MKEGTNWEKERKGKEGRDGRGKGRGREISPPRSFIKVGA